MAYKDVNEQRRCWRDWYHRNKAKERQRRTARKRKLRQWKRALMATLKCERCPESHPATLEFHRRDPSKKEFSVSKMFGRSVETVKREMAKCDVLCANCHRKEHYRR